MSLFRQGQLSTYDPDLTTSDAFPIKRSYDSFADHSLELADHINHYFDACIKIEQKLPSILGTNFYGYYPLGPADAAAGTTTVVDSTQLLFATQASGFVLQYAGQEFTMVVPGLFGANPFQDPSFSFAVRADIVDSAAAGVFANTRQTSTSAWNSLLSYGGLVCSARPVSGGLGGNYIVRVSPLSTLSLGSKTRIENLQASDPSTVFYPFVGANAWSAYALKGFRTSIFSTRPFVAVVAAKWASGYGFSSAGSDCLALSSAYSERIKDSAGNWAVISSSRSGVAALEGAISENHYVDFRISGFAAEKAFPGAAFMLAGPAVRAQGSADDATFYALVLGDATGTQDSTGVATPQNEGAPVTGYLAKFRGVDLRGSIAGTKTLYSTFASVPGSSSVLPKMQALTASTVLSYNTVANEFAYRLAASGSVLTLSRVVSGVLMPIASYADAAPIRNGSPGFFSYGRAVSSTSTTKANRWLFLDGLRFGELGTGASLSISLRAFYLKNGSGPFGPNTSWSAPVVSGTVVRWNDPLNVAVRGWDVGLPWQLGNNNKLEPYAGGVLAKMDWDPDGYHRLDFSVLARVPSGLDFSTGRWAAKFTVKMDRGNYLSTDVFPGGYSVFEFGLSDSATATVRSAEGVKAPGKILYARVPIENVAYSAFDSRTNWPRQADVSLVLDGFDTFRANPRTIYVKGAILTDGLDGVHISDITFAPL